MAMKTREDALFNAYLNNYRIAQAQAVNSGVQATQAARQRGAALLNATDKTLPVLKNQLADVGTAAITGANSNFKLTQQAAEMANDQFTKKLQDDADLAIQKQHEAWYLAKEAEKAARASSSSKSGSVTTNSDSYAAMTAASDSLKGKTTQGSNAAKDVQTKQLKGKDTAQRSNAERNARARAQYDGSEQEKSDIKYRAQQKREQTVQMLKDKQAAANAGANKGKPGGNSYAERQNAAQPAQSRAVTKGGKVIGSSYAAAGRAPSASERTAAKQRQERVAGSLQKLQTDASYRAELAKAGRKLDSAETEAVNQYVKSTKNTGFSGLKRVIDLAKNSDNLSKEEYAKKSAELNAELNQNSALRSKAQGNGAGQSAQAFTAGLYDSVPFLSKTSDAMASAANATGLGAELPMLTKTL